MKKVLSLLLALILLVSFSACGGRSENVTSVASSTESSQSNVSSDEPSSSSDVSSASDIQNDSKTPETIEITLDNWNEYIEFATRYVPSINGFDEIDSVNYFFDIRLKEEYLEALDSNNSSVTVELSFARGTQYGAFSEDYSAFTADGEYVKWEGAEKTEVYELGMTGYGFAACYTLASADFENNSFGPFYPSEEVVLRISGTIVLN